MAVTLIAVLLTLLLSRALPHLAQWRNFSWVRRWMARLDRNNPTWLSLVLIVGLPVLACLILQMTLHTAIYGLFSLLFAIAMLFYCWGPSDFERDIEAIVKAPDSERRLAAAQALRQDATDASLPLDAAALVEASFHAALRNWFGVMFWFFLLGPAGALLYRLARTVAFDSGLTSEAPAKQTEMAQRLVRLLDWLPAHLIALSLAIVSNFDAVLRTWRGYHLAQAKGYFTLDLGFLGAIARASVDADVMEGDGFSEDTSNVLVELQDALQLLRRVLVVWLSLMAIIVLAGWAA